MFVHNERGFTLPELLTVTVVTVVLLGISMLVLRPVDYTNENQDAERQLHIAMIAQALSKYRDKHGTFPEGLPAKATEIGSTEDSFDLCKALVPAYLKEMPLNPGIALTVKGTEAQPELDTKPCAHASESQYLSGYLIEQSNDGRVEVQAATAAGDQLTVIVR